MKHLRFFFTAVSGLDPFAVTEPALEVPSSSRSPWKGPALKYPSWTVQRFFFFLIKKKQTERFFSLWDPCHHTHTYRRSLQYFHLLPQFSHLFFSTPKQRFRGWFSLCTWASNTIPGFAIPIKSAPQMLSGATSRYVLSNCNHTAVSLIGMSQTRQPPRWCLLPRLLQLSLELFY